MELINIRPATNNDLDTLFKFEQGVIEAERPLDPTLKTGHIQYYDLQEMINSDHVHLVVAEVDDNIVGSGYARIEKSKIFYRHPCYAYLGFMYVLPEYREKGINREIIETLKRWSVSKNISELRLEVYHGNLPALNAYRKIGFMDHMIEMRLGV